MTASSGFTAFPIGAIMGANPWAAKLTPIGGRHMRPSYVLTASDIDGRVMLHELYYSGRKARRAFERLQTLSSDGFRTILLEDGRSESISRGRDLDIKLRFLGGPLWTQRRPWKTSFFDTTDEEFQELSQIHGIPVRLLKQIADLERSYYENSGSVRWDAFKRAYIPRFMFQWL